MGEGKPFQFKIQKPTESQIEHQILHYLCVSKRLMAWKNPSGGYFDAKVKRFRRQASPFARRGVPDIIAILDGKFVGFEVKSAKGVQSEEQKFFQADVQKAKGFYFLVRSIEDVEQALSTLSAP